MGEFRIGHGFARHSYPDSPRGSTSAFARNFADGPEEDTNITTGAGTAVPWANIESGASPGVNVPITPAVSGVIRVKAVLSFASSTDNSQSIRVWAQINGVDIPAPAAEENVIDNTEADGACVMALVVETPATIGATANIVVRAAASGGGGTVRIAAASSTVSVQEVPASTG